NVVTASAAQIAVALSAGPAGATLLGMLSVNASSGVSTFSDLAIQLAGAGYALTATSSEASSAVSAAFTIFPAAPARVFFSSQPANAVAGMPFSPAVAASLGDAFGNLCTNSSAVVHLAMKDNAASLFGAADVA